MHVVVAGCGWLGTAAAEALLARGDRVTAVVRSLSHAVRLIQGGIDCVARDLTRTGASDDLPGDVDAILATQAAAGSDLDAYRRAYLDVTTELLRFAGRVGAGALVSTGSTGVFGQSDGSEVDEATAPSPVDATSEVLVEAERLVIEASHDRLRTCVVRASGLYGKGRTGVIERVRSGAMALGPGDDVWMNFCHQDDAVAILLAGLDRGRPAAIYHASDARPAQRREVIAWTAMRLKMTVPHRESGDTATGRRGANRRVQSTRTRDELGVRLAYPSYRKGFAPLTVTLRT